MYLPRFLCASNFIYVLKFLVCLSVHKHESQFLGMPQTSVRLVHGKVNRWKAVGGKGGRGPYRAIELAHVRP